jgi:hypothetical protein
VFAEIPRYFAAFCTLRNAVSTVGCVWLRIANLRGENVLAGTVLAEGRTRFTAEVFMVEEPGRVRPLWQVGPTPRTQCDV